MSYKRFNRHECFGSEMMSYHSKTIRMVEDYLIMNDKGMMNNLINMLYGIWDGYLDDELTKVSYEALPEELHTRIVDVVVSIENYIDINN